MTLEARLLEWGEAWARARGYYHRRGGDLDPQEPGWEPGEWTVFVDKSRILVAALHEQPEQRWWLTPLQFWLWAHAVDTGRTDSQRCPDCEGSKVKAVKRTNPGPRCTMDAATDPAQVVALSVDEDGVTTRTISRPCPTCTGPAVECSTCGGSTYVDDCSGCGTMDAPLRARCRFCDQGTIPGKPLGYISRPLARVVCEAMPRECSKCQGSGRYTNVVLCTITSCRRCKGEGIHPGDPAARLALGLHADALQAEGDPLGQALALWLHGVPCEACERDGEVLVPWSADGLVRRMCIRCHGDGTALGAHAAAQLESGARELGPPPRSPSRFGGVQVTEPKPLLALD